MAEAGLHPAAVSARLVPVGSAVPEYDDEAAVVLSEGWPEFIFHDVGVSSYVERRADYFADLDFYLLDGDRTLHDLPSGQYTTRTCCFMRSPLPAGVRPAGSCVRQRPAGAVRHPERQAFNKTCRRELGAPPRTIRGG